MKDYSFRIGEENINNYCNKMKVIDIVDSKNVIVEFVDFNYTKKVTYYNFKKGLVGSPFDRTICGIGYIGVGKYKPYENGKQPLAYRRWVSMLRRCYDPKTQKKRPRYEGCKVCKKWHCYQNFAEWFYKHYYTLDGQNICLDKDILIKNNKIYSPETCAFVPNDINVLFEKSNKIRGEYPIGVSYNKEKDKFESFIKYYGKKKFLGYYETPEDAFLAYKRFKEKYIKELADKYKFYISEEIYQVMYNYEVEITD